MVANELGIDPVALDEAWIRADQAHEFAVLSALSQLAIVHAPNSGSVVNINVISESKVSSVRFSNPIG